MPYFPVGFCPAQCLYFSSLDLSFYPFGVCDSFHCKHLGEIMIIFVTGTWSCPLCLSAFLRVLVAHHVPSDGSEQEQHTWLTFRNTGEESQHPRISSVSRCAGHCCVITGGGRGIKNKKANDWFREMTVCCQKPVTTEQVQGDESSL